MATLCIKDMIQLVTRYAPDRDRPDARANALASTVTMIGALVLARAVDDEQLEVRPGADARTKLLSLTLAGKAKLAEGQVRWQRANEQVGAFLCA